MDPTAVVSRFVAACIDGDVPEAQDAEEVYSDWLGRGGFPASSGELFVARLDAEAQRVGMVRVPGNRLTWVDVHNLTQWAS